MTIIGHIQVFKTTRGGKFLTFLDKLLLIYKCRKIIAEKWTQSGSILNSLHSLKIHNIYITMMSLESVLSKPIKSLLEWTLRYLWCRLCRVSYLLVSSAINKSKPQKPNTKKLLE